MKKLLIITYYWPPSGGAGVQRTLKFVKYLPEFGIEPIVLTVDPNVASYPAIDHSLLNEVGNNVKVVTTDSFEPLQILAKVVGKKRVPHSGFANVKKDSIFQKSLKFIRGNLFIPDARIGWNRYAYKVAKMLIKEHAIDTFMISSPPHSSQLMGLKLKKQFPALKWIADLRDPWTDIYYYKELMHTDVAVRLDAKYELQVLKNADECLVVSDPIKSLFLQKDCSLSKQKFHVIPNGFDEEDFENDVQSPTDHFLITYVGALPVSYNPHIFFKTIKRLIDTNGIRKIKLRFVGTLPSDLLSEFKSIGIDQDSVEFISYVDHKKAVRYMQESSALLLVIPDVDNSEGILTGKLFEYLGSGRPIIGLGPVTGSAARIIKECGAGELFNRNDENALYEYLCRIVKEKMSIDLAKSNKYSRKSLTAELVKLI